MTPTEASALLNPRERDYLARLALGARQRTIAAEDGLAQQTVNDVIRRAYGKLGVDTMVEAFRALGWLKAGG